MSRNSEAGSFHQKARFFSSQDGLTYILDPKEIELIFSLSSFRSKRVQDLCPKNSPNEKVQIYLDNTEGYPAPDRPQI